VGGLHAGELRRALRGDRARRGERAGTRLLRRPPRGRATQAVDRDLGVPEHYLRLAVGAKHKAANERRRGRLGTRLAIDEASLKKNFVYATVFSDPVRGVVIDVGPGRDGAAVWAFAGLYSAAERAAVRVVTMDCHAPYRYIVRLAFPNAMIVADAFHLHRQANYALAEVRRAAWNRLRRASGKAAGKMMKDARYGLARARDELVNDTSARGLRQRQAVEAADRSRHEADGGVPVDRDEDSRPAAVLRTRGSGRS